MAILSKILFEELREARRDHEALTASDRALGHRLAEAWLGER